MRKNSSSLNNQIVSINGAERGFSLVELLIAMTIFTIVTGAIYGVLKVAQQSRTVTNQQVHLTKNIRFALNLIGRDTYNAGYGYPAKNTVVVPNNRMKTLLGFTLDNNTERDEAPPIIVGNDLNANTYNTTPNTKTDQVTFLFKDSGFNLVGGVSQTISINNPTIGTSGIDEIVPLSGSNSACAANDIYLITGNTGSVLAVATGLSGGNKVQFGNGDSLGLNLAGSSGFMNTITLPATLQKVNMVTYFVTTDGILTRREYANTGITPPATASPANYRDEPLVYGVEDFQMEYVLDDGTLSASPGAGPDGTLGTTDDTPEKLKLIRQVRFTIKVKSPEKDASGKPFEATMTSTFSTRNMGYDAS